MTVANRGAAQQGSRLALPRTWALVVGMLVAAALAMVLAVRVPLAVTVLGLILFGVLHNVLEIRYVAGRFAGLLTGRFVALLLILISGIVLCRTIGMLVPAVFRPAEIAIGYLVLAVGCWIGLRQDGRSPVPLVARLTVLAGAAVLSFAFPDYHFVVLTHLHNLVPLVFLWDWATRLPTPAGRRAFRATQVLWIVIVPTLILLGVFDLAIMNDPGVVQRFVGDGSRVIAATAPPLTSYDAATATTVGLRFLVMFAFMQTMHYVVWVGFLPRFAPDAAARFDAKVPWLRGRRAWLVGIAGGALLAVVFAADYFQGKALYSALASYHAYLEFPVLLALLIGVRATSPTPR